MHCCLCKDGGLNGISESGWGWRWGWMEIGHHSPESIFLTQAMSTLCYPHCFQPYYQSVWCTICSPCTVCLPYLHCSINSIKILSEVLVIMWPCFFPLEGVILSNLKQDCLLICITKNVGTFGAYFLQKHALLVNMRFLKSKFCHPLKTIYYWLWPQW